MIIKQQVKIIQKNLNNKATNIARQLSTFFDKVLTFKASYTFLLMVALAFVAPILFAGVDYIDDTSRKLDGSYQWGSLGRVLTEIFMHAATVNFGSMTYVGNMLQILSVPVLALTAFVFARSLRTDKKVTPFELLVSIPLILNPLLLANLSFRYDSLSMVLGNFLAVSAACFFFELKGFKKYLIPFVLIFSAAAFYQSTILMFAVVILILFFVKYAVDKNKNVKPLYPSLFGAGIVFVASSGAYFLMTKIISFSNLVGTRSTFVEINKNGLKAVRDNFINAFDTVTHFTANREAHLLFTIFVTVAIIGFVLIVAKALVARKSKVDTLFVILIPALLLLCFLGPLALMVSDIVLQVRTLTSAIGIVLLLTSVVYVLYRLGYKWAIWLTILPVLVGLYVLNFSFVYGNAISSQRAYDTSINNTLISVITNDKKIQTAETIFIGGDYGYSRTVKSQIAKRPLLNKMYLGGDNSRWYQQNTTRDFGVANNVDLYLGINESGAASASVCGSTNLAHPYLENEFFNIYEADAKTFIVWFHDPFLNTGDICQQR